MALPARKPSVLFERDFESWQPSRIEQQMNTVLYLSTVVCAVLVIVSAQMGWI